MTIGIKLDVAFRKRESYRKLYTNKEILPALTALGIDAAEFPVGAETAEEALLRDADLCMRNGLTVSLHPYSERTRIQSRTIHS